MFAILDTVSLGKLAGRLMIGVLIPEIPLSNVATKLTLARTTYFPILDRTWGGGTPSPRLACLLIEIERRNKDKRKDRDVLNLTIADFTTLGHILTFPGQVKKKYVAFLGRSSFFANNV